MLENQAIRSASGSTREIDRFRKALAPVASDGFGTLMPSHGWVFNRPNPTVDANRLPQDSRSSPNERDRILRSSPLFFGKLHYTRYSRPNMDDITSSGSSLELLVNPNRIAPCNAPRHGNQPPLSELFADVLSPATNAEVPTEPKDPDNWLPLGIMDEYYSPTRWPDNLRYFLGLKTLLSEELRNASRIAGTLPMPL